MSVSAASAAGREARIPFVLYGDEEGPAVRYVPSGYMGDASSFKLVGSAASAPLPQGRTGSTSLRIQYLPKGFNGWAGLYWLTPANNWGKIKGAGFNLTGAKRLTFWMRGAKGGEKIAEVKMGGILGPYPDSDTAGLGPLRLSRDWKKHSIDLTGKDLSHIVGGFAISVRRADNPRGATFYLDEIVYDLAESTSSVLPSPMPSVQISTSSLPNPQLPSVFPPTSTAPSPLPSPSPAPAKGGKKE